MELKEYDNLKDLLAIVACLPSAPTVVDLSVFWHTHQHKRLSYKEHCQKEFSPYKLLFMCFLKVSAHYFIRKGISSLLLSQCCSLELIADNYYIQGTRLGPARHTEK